jgi:hypothetical protein
MMPAFLPRWHWSGSTFEWANGVAVEPGISSRDQAITGSPPPPKSATAHSEKDEMMHPSIDPNDESGYISWDPGYELFKQANE